MRRKFNTEEGMKFKEKDVWCEEHKKPILLHLISFSLGMNI